MTDPRLGRLRSLLVVPLAVTAVVTASGYAAVPWLETPDTTALGPGEVTVQIDIHHSAFVPDRVTVIEGTRVRFLVVNGDPIGHELITGGPDVHLRHTNGSEAEHPSVLGEVSVGPNDTAFTTFTFDTPGVYEFACHLPGHYEYGMQGEIEVVRAAEAARGRG